MPNSQCHEEEKGSSLEFKTISSQSSTRYMPWLKIRIYSSIWCSSFPTVHDTLPSSVLSIVIHLNPSDHTPLTFWPWLQFPLYHSLYSNNFQRGTQFCSSILSALHKGPGIDHLTSAVYHPQSYVMVSMSFVKSLARAHQAWSQWLDQLPWGLLGLRVASKEDFTASPELELVSPGFTWSPVFPTGGASPSSKGRLRHSPAPNHSASDFCTGSGSCACLPTAGGGLCVHSFVGWCSTHTSAPVPGAISSDSEAKEVLHALDGGQERSSLCGLAQATSGTSSGLSSASPSSWLTS